MRLTVYIANAFTLPGAAATSGNPAAVVLLAPDQLAAATDGLRQRLAAAIGLSETAFVEPLDPGSASPDAFATADAFRLRWFTPGSEVPLCGHATLASAATIFSECGNAAPALRFETLSGPLTVTRQQAGDGGGGGGGALLEMALPLCAATDPLPAALVPAGGASGAPVAALLAGGPPLARLLAACLRGLPGAPPPGADAGVESDWLAGAVAHVGFSAPLRYLLVVLAPRFTGAAALTRLAPDPAALLGAAPPGAVGGVIVTCRGADGPGAAADGQPDAVDFVSRFFAPWLAVDEDPVTGSAHAVLGPYWAAALGETEVSAPRPVLRAAQLSARGGVLEVLVPPAAPPGRVLVRGAGAVVERGERECE
ncbi:hypothetical protein HT031_006632 [Scenedesmus sp. PABB004]|nr:hypothetical protein HT031_006632 [Scenedesmus sp. PABB004]